MPDETKVKAPRQPVASKDDFLAIAQPALAGVLGEKVSKAKTWEAFKVLIGAAGDAARLPGKAALSLSGVGRFHAFSSARSVAKNQPALRLRFKPSSKINAVLNAGTSLVEAMRQPDEVDAAPTPTAPTAEAPL